jgi:hypothetical protein
MVTTNIACVSPDAASTGAAADEVLSAAGELSRQAESLSAEVIGFVSDVRARRRRAFLPLPQGRGREAGEGWGGGVWRNTTPAHRLVVQPDAPTLTACYANFPGAC